MNEIILSAKTSHDQITDRIKNAFDYDVASVGVVTKIKVPHDIPDDFSIGLIVGSSGSGKTTLLKTLFGYEDSPVFWDNSKCIASNFCSFEEASDKLGAVGLNSIPSWLKPYSVLSNGEKFRADLARKLHDGAVIDEFTSVVNREAAISCCVSVQKYIRQNGLEKIVFCSCHDDIIPYLQPDWVYNTDTHKLHPGRYLQRPEICIKVLRCGVGAWELFRHHHYLNEDLNKSSRCYLGTYNDIPVAFCAVLSMPSGTLKNSFREHRLVVLPDYQGMGIGNRFSETIAEIYVKDGNRYFSKTANPRAGLHRDNSRLWRPTSKNHKARPDYLRQMVDYNGMLELSKKHADRMCFSHEYIGKTVEGNVQDGCLHP